MEARLTQDSTNDSYRSDLNHRKRLGQYLTGTKLARLLAYLARTDNDGFAIDPMCGNGDMIEAIRSIAPSKQMYGIESDKNTLKLCANRFKATADKSYVHLIEGDAFSWDTISRLKTYEYDLVITNPPYVRYQSLTGSAE